MVTFRLMFATLGLLLSCTSLASAEQYALLNYESKPNQPVRREGIAIMDIDPASPDFGKILMEIPVTFAVVGAVFAPVLAAIGALAALVSKCTLEVERK